jgi:hypothetical protein
MIAASIGVKIKDDAKVIIYPHEEKGSGFKPLKD